MGRGWPAVLSRRGHRQAVSRLACSRRGPKPSDCVKTHPAHRGPPWAFGSASVLVRCSRRLSASASALLRTGERLSAHAFVRITPRHEENRRKAGRFCPRAAIYAVPESLSRPILRTYSAEVTSSNEQSPASSHSAPTQALDYCTTDRRVKSRKISRDLSSFFNGFPVPQAVVAVGFDEHDLLLFSLRPLDGSAILTYDQKSPFPSGYHHNI